MKVSTLCFLVLLIAIITVDISDAVGGGRGGGGRGGGGRGGGGRSGSRGSRSSRGGSRSRSSSGSKPKIFKNTPIKPTSRHSPVIKLQTKVGSRSAIFKGVLVGYVVHRYVLSNAPVYRQGYSMYGSYVSIPNDRAVRLSSEEEKMLDASGNLCLGQSRRQRALRNDIDKFLVEVKTTITYKSRGTTPLTFHGANKTVSLKDVSEGEEIKVVSRARYSTTLVSGTVCTQVEKTVEGTMVKLYETNPNGASTVTVNILMISSMTLFGLIQVFKPAFFAAI